MKRSFAFRSRLFALSAAVLIAALMLMAIAHDQLMARILNRQLDTYVEATTPFLHSALAQPLAARDFASIHSILDESVRKHGFTHLVLLDSRDSVISASGWDVALHGLPVPVGAPVVGPAGAEVMLYQMPVQFAGQTLGKLYFGLPCKPLVDARLEMLGWSLLILLVSLVVAAAVLEIGQRWLMRPLMMLNQASEQIRRGDYDINVQIRDSSEIGRLAEAFNVMAGEIKVRIRDLTQSESRQRHLLEQARAREQELARAKQRAELAASAKSDFLAVMSHELRTPLGVVVGAVDLLADTPLDNDQRRLAQVALTSASQLTDLIGNILDTTKLERGQISLEEVPFELYDILKSAQQIAEIKAAPKGLEIRCDIDDDLQTGRLGDPTRLRQVLVNLLINAVKFTERGSVRLTVSETDSSDRLMFRVRDTGIGVPAGLQATLFDRFVQADQSPTRNFNGTGLGLAISREIVTAMGGEIGVDSMPGEGSVFWFTALLPIVLKSEILVANRSRTAVRRVLTSEVRPRILLVEDAPENRLIIQKMLERLGYSVMEAENGEEGVSAASQDSFDIIIMDIRMPKLDGLSATRQIRSGSGPNRATPIIALTGNAFEEDRQQGLAAGCSDYLAKPVRISVLREVLGKYAHARF